MIIKEIKLKNFVCYKDVTLKLKSDGEKNISIIWGNNNDGKSTFFNSIKWVLYGKTTDSNKYSEIINKENYEKDDYEMSVELNFEDDNHDENILIRKIKAKKDKPINNDDWEEEKSLMIGGKPTIDKDIDEKIGNLMPEKISHFFLFDGEKMNEYKKLVIEEERKKITGLQQEIEQVLGAPAFVNAIKDFKELKTISSKEFEGEKQADATVKTLQQNLAVENKKLLQKEEDKTNIIKNINEAKNKKKNVEDYLKKHEGAEQLLIDEAKCVEKIKNNKKQRNDHIEELKPKNSLIYKDLLIPHFLKIQKRIEENTDELYEKIFIKEVEKLSNKKGFSTESKNVVKNYIEEKENEKKQNLSENIKRNSSIILEQKDQGSLKEIEKWCKKIKDCDENIQKYQNELDSIKDKFKDFSKEKLRESVEEKFLQQTQILENEKIITKINNEIEVIEKEKGEIASDIKKRLGGKMSEKFKKQEIMSDFHKLLNEGLQKFIQERRKDIENDASETFLQLCQEKDFTSLQINERFGLNIRHKNGDIVKITGESLKNFVALSLVVALNKMARNSAPIIMDTPTGRIDKIQTNNITKFLPKMAKQLILLIQPDEMDPNIVNKHCIKYIAHQYYIERKTAFDKRIKEGGSEKLSKG